MNDFIFSVNVVLPLFLLISAGYAAKRFKFVSDAFWAETNRFVFRIPLPLMLFQNVRTAFAGNFVNPKLILASVIGVTCVIAVLPLIVPLFEKRKIRSGSLIQGMFRSNFIIYGMPLATGMYGDAASVPISCMLGLIVPMYNIAAIIILTFCSNKKQFSSLSPISILREIFNNPLIISCIAGGIAGWTNVPLPHFVEVPLNDVARIAAPLALFVMGGEFRFNSLRNNLLPVICASAAKLVVIPLIAIAVFIQIGFRQMELAALTVLFATPTSVSSYIMAENMGCDGELSAQIVVFTTAFSVFTIFLFIFALKSLGYF
ncbi:MAG: AEC family transporter [Prevotellaceae bacterium]|jgi:predicted permease|nr:AEC family transporter [Prevotellaceae bacterium]